MVKCKFASCGRTLTQISSIRNRAGQHCLKKYGSLLSEQTDNRNPKDLDKELKILRLLQFSNIKIVPTSSRNIKRTTNRYKEKHSMLEEYSPNDFDEIKKGIMENPDAKVILYDIDLNEKETELRIRILVPTAILLTEVL